MNFIPGDLAKFRENPNDRPTIVVVTRAFGWDGNYLVIPEDLYEDGFTDWWLDSFEVSRSQLRLCDKD